MSRIEVRIQDYLKMGVPYVWVLDPRTKQAYVATTADGLREVKSGVLATANPAFEVPLGRKCSGIERAGRKTCPTNPRAFGWEQLP